MEDFRIVLMVLGIVAVAALVAHGMWTIRRNNQEHEITDEIQTKDKKTKKKASLKDKLSAMASSSSDDTHVEHSRVEPDLDEGQMEMDLPDDEHHLSEDKIEPAIEPQSEDDAELINHSTSNESAAGEPQEVLILNVTAPEGKLIQGAELLPFLLTLGFKYGEMAIFHRHEESSGEGEVLFSLANMFNPGTFDIDNMETFTTQGISLFMSLPVQGEASQVFNMMHNAAKKIAAEFEGQVLDGQRSVLTRQTVQHYVERIREYERKQLLKSS